MQQLPDTKYAEFFIHIFILNLIIRYAYLITLSLNVRLKRG